LSWLLSGGVSAAVGAEQGRICRDNVPRAKGLEPRMVLPNAMWCDVMHFGQPVLGARAWNDGILGGLGVVTR